MTKKGNFTQYQMKTLKKKSKTIKLPCASLSFKVSSCEYERDDEKLMEFIRNNVDNPNDYIATTSKVKWADLKATLIEADDGNMVTSDGIVVEGVKWHRDEIDTFNVKLKGV